MGQWFCDACGNALSVAGQAAATIGEAPRAPGFRLDVPGHLAEKIRAGRSRLEGERKQVTVLFADVVDSMELSERVGAEQWREVMERFFALSCQGVHRFEGTVDRFTGDGVIALFGAPIAHEDHARRACFAVLYLQRELVALAEEIRREEGIDLSVRMGLNSGEVIVGEIGEDLEMVYTAIGPTVGLGQRMEQLAKPGEAYLTEHTAALLGEYLALADLGEHQVKGVNRPLRVYELTGVGPAHGGLDMSRSRGFTSFVGRKEELWALEGARARALSGQGQVVGIVGEPGVGKSRLCHEFAQRCRARGMAVYHVAGQAHARAVPLLPVLQLMRASFGIDERDSAESARERIAGRLLSLDAGVAEDLSLLFDFLGVPDPDNPPPRMDPEARQRRLVGVTRRLIHAQSEREPTLYLFEDLHWVDPASQVFLSSHLAAVHGTRNLTVVNFRPDYYAPWMSSSYYRQLALAPLRHEAVEAMLGERLGSDPLLAGLGGLIWERTGGNPFFIEELVQSLIEAGNLVGERGAYTLARPVEDTAVPASVQAVLSARIDRLSEPEKELLQAAAVIGKGFSAPLLARVVDVEEEELQNVLQGLVAAEFVYEQELYPEAAYAFVHPLTQEVAYRSQLAKRRAAVHAAVAGAIAAQYPERLDERAALVAQHWEAAGRTLEAARWHARAASWAGFNDPAQAMSHWRKVRDLTASLPASVETTGMSLAARISLLNYGWRLGMSLEDAKEAFEEGERIAVKAGDVRSQTLLIMLHSAIRGLGAGDVPAYARGTRRALAIAEKSGDHALYLAASISLYALFCAAEFREGVALVDRAIQLAEGDPTVGADMVIGCPYATCHLFKGGFVTSLGRFDEARVLIERGVQLAREQGDIETAGWGPSWGAWLDYCVGDSDALLGHAQQAIEVFERIGDTFSRAWAWAWLGIAHSMRREWRQAIDGLERGVALSRERRTAFPVQGWWLAVLGEAYLGTGQRERARELAEEGVAMNRAHGARVFELLATLSFARVLLRLDGIQARDQVEAPLALAMRSVRETGAKALEPMLHVELAELARLAGGEDHRQQELATAYCLFAEVGATGYAERIASQLAVSAS